ncbi:MAG: TIGR01777 family oxidoreductase [Candidatus Sulfotelmatobacter sp.]|jgi:uncharacterized protein (TIGR01777 family)
MEKAVTAASSLVHYALMDRMAKILVSGVSGPIGAALLPSLQSSGAKIVRLMRARSGVGPTTATGVVPWDPEKHIAPEAVSGFDAVIHLAGESIVGRWSAAKKAKIRDSRVVGTRNLAEALAQAKSKPQVFVCSSAIGYYGDRGDEVLNEKTTAGAGFLAEVCRDWEAATQPASAAGIRTVQIRTGVVLSPKGGALGKMLTPFKMGVGGRIGSGRQWMSWIDIADMVGAIQHILKSDALQGPVNLVAPRPVTNAEFTKTLASVLSRPAIFPVPAFAVKLAFGEMGKTVLLAGQRVEPAQLVASGYPFRVSELRASLENALKP